MEASGAETRVSILLSALGADVTGTILDAMDPEDAARLKEHLERLNLNPPSADEVDEVLDEFDRSLRLATHFAASTRGDAVDGGQGLKIHDPGEDFAPAPAAPPSSATTFQPSGDLFDDLNRLEPQRIAVAIQSEPARLVVLVVSSLNVQQAAEVIRRLPSELRGNVCVELGKGVKAPRALTEHLLRTTIDKALALDERELGGEHLDADHRLAQVLRSMTRQARADVIATMEEKDAEMVARIRDLLYEFNDLLAVDDSSIQKLLAEIETTVLATALYNVDESIQEKILRNLSKRAQQTLMEEIEFKGAVSPETVEEARAQIVKAMSELDQAGKLIMNG
jgi:flagellar motor switch protein FliG